MKVVCGLGRTNYGGLLNMRPLIMDPREQGAFEGMQLLKSVKSVKLWFLFYPSVAIAIP